jgi:hypothetical protein
MNLLNEHIDNWFEAFAEYEALISLAFLLIKILNTIIRFVEKI